jgi:hypothetical protein
LRDESERSAMSTGQPLASEQLLMRGLWTRS